MDQATSLLHRGTSRNPGTASRLRSMHVLALAMLVCLTGNAVELDGKHTPPQTPASTAALQSEQVTGQKQSLPSKPLDLRVPDITRLFPPEELERMLGSTKDRAIDEVEVEGARTIDLLPLNTPAVWPGLFAPLWALAHPTQAWRIFAPIPSDQ